MSPNPSTALARVLVDELIRCGVREAVLAPGSRNAPLALALHAADAAGRLRLHVRIDERSAGFLALGLARAGGDPVIVTCTSGTAAVNLHPAVVEAGHGGVPVIALTADRPAALRDTGANQTIDQAGLYGSAVRYATGIAAPGRVANADWRTLVDRAVGVARGRGGWPGPVQVNVEFGMPLVPDADDTGDTADPADARPDALPGALPGTLAGALSGAPAGRPDGGPWVRLPAVARRETGEVQTVPARTLVVVGDAPAQLGSAAADLADELDLPLVAEPSSGAWAARSNLDAGTLLLGDDAFLDAHAPEHVLVVGRPTLGRAVGRLVQRPGVRFTAVTRAPMWTDPEHAASMVLDAVPAAAREQPRDPEWTAAWRAADARAAAALEDWLAGGALSGPGVARTLVDALPSGALLLVGSSNPIRDVDLAARRRGDLTVLANRGAAGIDGTVSTAVGAALATQRAGGGPAYALLGDLTLLHDANGLILGPDEPVPDLTLVVANNNGGGVFGVLEQGAPEHAASFERVFGTPHGVDLGALCAASGTAYERALGVADLRRAAAPGKGVRVVEVPLDRAGDRPRAAELRAAVNRALAG